MTSFTGALTIFQTYTRSIYVERKYAILPLAYVLQIPNLTLYED